MRLIATSCIGVCMIGAIVGDVAANQCPTKVDGTFFEATSEDVMNIRTMVNNAEEGLAELESLVVRTAEDVVVAREASMKIAPLVALAGERDAVGSMAARGFLSRRGVDWGVSVQKDVQESISLQPHTLSEPGETTPLLQDAIRASPEARYSIGSLAFKWAGRAFLVVGIGESAVHVYSADDHLEAAVEEGASWGASLGAAEAAGLSCAATGAEVIVPLCVIIGGVLGGYLGRITGEALFHGGHAPCYDASTGWNYCIWSSRPPI